MRFLALLLLLPCLARADWDNYDRALGIAAAGLVITDWGQTRYIAKHPDQFYETNGILGPHPSVGKVDRYFVGYLVTGYLIADWLSPGNRKTFLIVISAVELNATRGNKRIGVKIDF